MTILYYDIFLLLLTWFTGIGIHIPGMYIHFLPMLALIAVVIRFSAPLPMVKIAINPVRVGKSIRL